MNVAYFLKVSTALPVAAVLALAGCGGGGSGSGPQTTMDGGQTGGNTGGQTGGNTGGGVMTGGACSVGGTVSPGQSCSHSSPGNQFTFTVRADGTGCFGGSICSGQAVTINNFSARRNSDGSWEITSLPGDAMMQPTAMQPEEETTGTGSGTHSPYDYGTWSRSAQDAAAFGSKPNTVFGFVNTTMGLGVGYNSDGSWWIVTNRSSGQPKVSGVWLGNWNGRYGDGVMDSGRAAVRVQIADDVQAQLTYHGVRGFGTVRTDYIPVDEYGEFESDFFQLRSDGRDYTFLADGQFGGDEERGVVGTIGGGIVEVEGGIPRITEGTEFQSVYYGQRED